jgi:hypothetical protein
MRTASSALVAQCSKRAQSPMYPYCDAETCVGQVRVDGFGWLVVMHDVVNAVKRTALLPCYQYMPQ